MLSLVLRHKPQSIGIELDEAGWVNISDLIDALNASGKQINHELLLAIVYENDKQRFAISDDGQTIRANQGHSLDVDLGLAPVDPPPTLFHGTVAKFLESIKEHGLMPGSRQHVHLSADTTTAEIVARRRGQPIILTIKTKPMVDKGHQFFRSANGVWLIRSVPAKFIDFD